MNNDSLKERIKKLNVPQQNAVNACEGPVLIFAGAGSGKTMVITHRIANLLENGISPFNIIAVTFTNKAAEEMKNRIKYLVGNDSMSVWVSTFHSMCLKILKIDGPKDFTIYDEQDQIVVIKQVLKKMELEPKKFPPAKIKEIISSSKNNLMDPESFKINASIHNDNMRYTLGNIYEEYQNILRKNSGYDFADLLSETIRLFKENEEVLNKYRDRFQYILVDEYQDTNYAQYTLLKLISPPQNNICVVGDDDQSIYSWRGADIRNILEFEKSYKSASVFKLEENYRSTQNILDVAHNVIMYNSSRKHKRLWTKREKGETVKWQEFLTNREEALGVVSEIRRLRNEEGMMPSEMAIFYRVNAQTRSFEDVLRSSGINYRIIGGVKFYERKEIKDILSYMRVLLNNNDDVSMGRCINCPPRGIGEKTVNNIKSLAIENDISVYRLINERIELAPVNIRKKLEPLKVLFQRLSNTLEEDDAAKLAKEVIELSGYHRMLEEVDDIQSQSRIENIEELVSAFAEDENREKSVKEILDEIALLTDMDTKVDEDEYVTLMTVHLAKGLEFPAVFLTGLEEELFPHYDALRDPVQMEEERRLCYVGMTRAKDRLYLTSASQRMLYGQSRWHIPSRFIKEGKLDDPGQEEDQDPDEEIYIYD